METRSNLQVPVDPPAQKEKKDIIEYFWEYFWEDPDPELEFLSEGQGRTVGAKKSSSLRPSKQNHPTKQNLVRRRRVKKDSRGLNTVNETARERTYRARAASPSNAVGASSDHSEGGIPEDSSIREAIAFSPRNRSIRSIKTLDTFDFIPGCRGASDYFVDVEGTPNLLLSCHDPADYTFITRIPHSELKSQPVLSRTPTMVASHLKDDIVAENSRLRGMGFVSSEQRDDEEEVTLFERLFGQFVPPEDEDEGGIDETESLSPRQQSFVWSNRSDLVWADHSSDINKKDRFEKETSRFPKIDHDDQFGGGESAASSRKQKNKQQNKLKFGWTSKAGTDTVTASDADMTHDKNTDRYSEGLPRGLSPWCRIDSYQSGCTSVDIPLNPIKNETSDNNSMKAVGDDCPMQEEPETRGPEPQLQRHDEILLLTLSEFTEDDTTVRRRPKGLLACRKGNLRELEESSIAETAQMSNTFKRFSCKRRDGNFDDDTSWQDMPDGYSNAERDDSILLLQLEPKKKDDFVDSILVNQMKSKGKTWSIPRKTCGRSGFDSDSVAESELSQNIGKKCILRPRWKGNDDIPTPSPLSIKQKPSVTFADETTVCDTLPDFSHDDAASLREVGRMNPHFRESPKTPEITRKSTLKQPPIAYEPAQITDPGTPVPETARRAEKAATPEPQSPVSEKAKSAEKAAKPESRAPIAEEMPGRSTRANIPEKSAPVARATILKKSTRAADPGKTESAVRVARPPPRSAHVSRNERPTINNRTARDRGGDSGSISAHSHYDYKARPRLQTTLPQPRLPKTLPSPRPKSLPKALPKTAPPKKALPPKRNKNIRPLVVDPPKTKEKVSTRYVASVHPFEADSDDYDDEDFTSGNDSDDGDDYDDDESYESQSSLYDRLGTVHKTKYSAFNILQSSWDDDDYSLDAMTKFSHR